MQDNAQWRSWLQQKNITVPQLFFRYYKQLQIADDEAMLLLHLIAYHEENNDFPTPDDIMARTSFMANEISMKIQRFLQKGFLEITQGVDTEGKIYEKYSFFPLWQRIFALLQADDVKDTMEQQKKEEGAVFAMFEQEFGRLLSPMELENITAWLDDDKHSPQLIRQALKEAVLAGKLSLRYIDRILFEWKKKNITSIQQVEQHTQQFRQKVVTQIPAQKIQKRELYNWLDEEDG